MMVANKHLDKKYLTNFSSLKKEIKRRGYYEKDSRTALLHLLTHYGCLVIGITLFVFSPFFLISFLSASLAMLGLIGISTHTHNYAHHTSTDNPILDQFLSYICLLYTSDAADD